jgi:predicted outer membrane repeat protein
MRVSQWFAPIVAFGAFCGFSASVQAQITVTAPVDGLSVMGTCTLSDALSIAQLGYNSFPQNTCLPNGTVTQNVTISLEPATIIMPGIANATNSTGSPLNITITSVAPGGRTVLQAPSSCAPSVVPPQYLAGGTTCTVGGAGLLETNNNNLTVSISNVNFENAALQSGAGGALRVEGDSTSMTMVSNATFSNNSALNGNGGAVLITGGTLQLNNVNFQQNSAQDTDQIILQGNGDGGAGLGGAIYMQSGRLINIDTPATPKNQTLFASNTAAYEGGAIYCEGGEIYLNYVDFSSNSTNGTVANLTALPPARGGAISSACNMALSFATFTSNVANTMNTATVTSQGGAIFISAATPAMNNLTGYPPLAPSQDPNLNQLQQTELLNGTMVNGAMINNPLIRDSYFSANYSMADGGAIYTDGPLYLVRSSMYQNSSGMGQYVDPNNLDYNIGNATGSGVFISPAVNDNPVLIANTTFEDNQQLNTAQGEFTDFAPIFVAYSAAAVVLINDTINAVNTTQTQWDQSGIFLQSGPTSGVNPILLMNTILTANLTQNGLGGSNAYTCGGDTTRVLNQITSGGMQITVQNLQFDYYYINNGTTPPAAISPIWYCSGDPANPTFSDVTTMNPLPLGTLQIGDDPTVPQAMQTFRPPTYTTLLGYAPLCNIAPVSKFDQLGVARPTSSCMLGAIQTLGSAPAPVTPPPAPKPPPPHKLID